MRIEHKSRNVAKLNSRNAIYQTAKFEKIQKYRILCETRTQYQRLARFAYLPLRDVVIN